MPGTSLGGRSILIVEDEALIALDMVEAADRRHALTPIGIQARPAAQALRCSASSATPALSSGRRTQWRGQDCTPIRGQSSAPIDIPDAAIHLQRRVLTLPGYFRPTKLWDILVMHKGRLIAALEFKSQVGPSFGNNFNNRAEEFIGTAVDFWTAYREGAFGKDTPRPFAAWLMLLEDCEESRSPVRDGSLHFPIFDDFKGASYSERYNILCRRLTEERLYSAATIITSARDAASTGAYNELGETTSLKNLVATFAAHIASEAVRG